jgi:hypothetical protein
VRNVLATGACTLERGGRRVELTDPVVLDRDDGMTQRHNPPLIALHPLIPPQRISAHRSLPTASDLALQPMSIHESHWPAPDG